MATYKGIQGYTVQNFTTDPTASAGAEGQLFYNSTTGKFKLAVAGAGSWASVASLSTPKSQVAGLGIATAAMATGGAVPAIVGTSETYNGSTWTEGNDMNSVRRNAKACGTTTAGMVVGGWGSPAGVTATEYYDGTCWSTQGGTLTRGGGYQSQALAGVSQASAMVYGGEPGTTYMKYTEEWNGTSWSEQNKLNTSRAACGGVGIVTAALAISGYTPPIATNVESYDGTSWTETSTDINSARAQLGASGTSTLCVAFGGNGPVALTESFNGTTWTEVGDLVTARSEPGNAQTPSMTNKSALCMGGLTGPVDAVEEFTDPSYSIKTVTVS
jgi:hypothetical protein